jgi:uncharacterized flavoprotein (TIGR03862 family)
MLAFQQPSIPMPASHNRYRAAVIGGGPAGLMAAELLGAAGVQVDLYDAMPSVGRKFLLAGKGGMNITHSEERAPFTARYGDRAQEVARWLDGFDGPAVRAWIAGLGIDTFVGSSGRVFPTDMKAAPLLRAWLHRLRESGVRLHMRHRWLVDGGGEGALDPVRLRFATPDGEVSAQADCVILALGGGSWKRLGSDGAWVAPLRAMGVEVRDLAPSNCGFEVAWSAHFRERYGGEPLLTVAASAAPDAPMRKGQFVVTEHGVEGSLVYALSASLRKQIEVAGSATLWLDLAPDWTADKVLAEVLHPRGSRSLASHLQSRLGIKGVKAGLLRECLSKEAYQDPALLAAAIKRLPVRLLRPRPIDEAISSAGGIAFAALDEHQMLRAAPGAFAAGEMIDWEAPTGGYLLTACFASGRAAALGALAWLATKPALAS